MGLRIGDSARTLPTFQSVGPLQGREPVRAPQRTEPAPSNQGRVSPLSARDREEIVQAALREPVSSAAAAAVRALGVNFRAIRAEQPSLEERSEQVRERFEQAREQVFGSESDRESDRAVRRAEAADAARDAAAIVREDTTTERAARFAPPERPEPVAPNARILQRFDEPTPPGAVDLRG